MKIDLSFFFFFIIKINQRQQSPSSVIDNIECMAQDNIRRSVEVVKI